jgi:hypothetical protein
MMGGDYRNALPSSSQYGDWNKFVMQANDGPVRTNVNVGIGINSPHEKLDGLGNIRIGGTHSIEGTNALSIKYGIGSLSNWRSLRRIYMSFGVKADTFTPEDWVFCNESLNYKTALTLSNSSGLLFLTANQQQTGINSPVAMSEIMKISPNGNAVLQGKLEAKEIKVTLTSTAYFVFAEDYKLPKLEDVEKHIKENKHLPEIAFANQMEKEGVNIGKFSD